MTDTVSPAEIEDALKYLSKEHVEQPYADNQRWHALRIIRWQKARIEGLETALTGEDT